MYNQKPLPGDLLDYGEPLSRGLVGLWLFNEGSGNKVFGLSLHRNTGTLEGSVNWKAGKFGSTLNFPGTTSDYVVIPIVKPSATYSISFWIYVEGAAIQYIFDARTDSGTGFIYWDNSDSTLHYHSGGNAFVDGIDTDIMSANAWHHVVISGLTMIIPTNIILGVMNALTAFPFDGMISDFLIFNCTLSISEIVLLYREPFCMVRTKKRRIIYDEIAGVPPTTFPYYYREIASRRIA